MLSLPRGQREAGLVIGLSSFRSRMIIELPQAIRRMMPSLVAQLVVLLKDTSIGYIVSYEELLRKVQIMADFLGPQFLFPIFFVAAAIYIVINICVSRLAVWIEQRGSKKAAGGTAPASPAAAVREGASMAKCTAGQEACGDMMLRGSTRPPGAMPHTPASPGNGTDQPDRFRGDASVPRYGCVGGMLKRPGKRTE